VLPAASGATLSTVRHWQAGDGAESAASEIKLKWTKLRPSGAVPSTRTGAVMVARPQTTMVRRRLISKTAWTWTNGILGRTRPCFLLTDCEGCIVKCGCWVMFWLIVLSAN
jgi:hypothetical protein